jgi:hypothetical protein
VTFKFYIHFSIVLDSSSQNFDACKCIYWPENRKRKIYRYPSSCIYQYLLMYGYVNNSFGSCKFTCKLKQCPEIFQESVAKKIPGSTKIPNTVPATTISLGVQIAAAWSGLSISVPRTQERRKTRGIRGGYRAHHCRRNAGWQCRPCSCILMIE